MELLSTQSSTSMSSCTHSSSSDFNLDNSKGLEVLFNKLILVAIKLTVHIKKLLQVYCRHPCQKLPDEAGVFKVGYEPIHLCGIGAIMTGSSS